MFLTWQGKVIVIAREVVVLTRMALALTTWLCNEEDADRVVAHRAGKRGKGAKFPTEAFEGGVVRELASAQRHQGGRGVGARHHMGRRGDDGVGSGVGEGGFAGAGAGGVGGDIDVLVVVGVASTAVVADVVAAGVIHGLGSAAEVRAVGDAASEAMAGVGGMNEGAQAG